MQVLTDAATCGILLRVVELLRTAAVLGEMATQWQQKMGSLQRATEAWTGGRHAADDKYVELDYELAVALANVTEGAARSTVLKGAQVEPFMGSWHGKRWLMVTRPSHRTRKIQGRKGIT